jgi:peptidoglycan/xylan/chitin deacetylase (PgdA/CDA1 family)
MIKNIFWKIISTFTPAGDLAPVILMYHSIGRNRAQFTVTPEAFEKQMAFLKSSGRECMKLSEFAERLRSGTLPANAVAVTFDDGYEDNFSEALPILKRYSIPATIFISTAYIGKTFMISDGIPLPFMSEDEIKQSLKTGLIELASHGHWHKVMRDLTKEGALQDIKESNRVAGNLIGKEPKCFAYPYGKYSEEMLAILKELGFECAVTVKEGVVDSRSNLFELPRMAIASSTSMAEFKCKVSKPRLYLAIKRLVRRNK